METVRPDGVVERKMPAMTTRSAATKRSYGDMLSPANLKAGENQHDGIGPWKPYLISWQAMTDPKNRQAHRRQRRQCDRPARHDPAEANDVVKRAHQLGLVVHPFTFRNEAKLLAANFQDNPAEEYRLFF